MMPEIYSLLGCLIVCGGGRAVTAPNAGLTHTPIAYRCIGRRPNLKSGRHRHGWTVAD